MGALAIECGRSFGEEESDRILLALGDEDLAADGELKLDAPGRHLLAFRFRRRSILSVFLAFGGAVRKV